MNTEKAIETMTDVIRRKHFTLSTEQCYCAWLRRYCDFMVKFPAHISSEQKLERFLTALAKKDMSASTQNQAFNAIFFFYKEVMGHKSLETTMGYLHADALGVRSPLDA